MNLLRESDGVAVAVACGVCGRHWSLKQAPEAVRQAATECCDKGLEDRLRRERRAAADRREAARIANARKLPESEYDGPVYWRDGKGYDEGYFETLDDLREWCDEADEPVPAEVWGCSRRRFKLPHADELVESAAEDHHEGVLDQVGDTEELEAAIRKWNDEQTAESWEPSDIRVVLDSAPVGETDHGPGCPWTCDDPESCPANVGTEP